MCKPSAHLIEYLDNQNINVYEIIKDLPDEMPVVELKDDDTINFVNASSNDASLKENIEVTKQSTQNIVPEQQKNLSIGNTGNITVSTQQQDIQHPAQIQKNAQVPQQSVTQNVLSQKNIPQSSQPVIPQLNPQQIVMPIQNANQQVAPYRPPIITKLGE